MVFHSRTDFGREWMTTRLGESFRVGQLPGIIMEVENQLLVAENQLFY